MKLKKYKGSAIPLTQRKQKNRQGPSQAAVRLRPLSISLNGRGFEAQNEVLKQVRLSPI